MLQLVRNKLIKRARSSLEQRPTSIKLQDDLQDAYHQTETPLPSPCAPRVSEFFVINSALQGSECLIDLIHDSCLLWQAMKDLHFNNIPLGDLGSPMDKMNFDPAKDVDLLLPVEVKEQRLSNLLQSLLVGLCVGAMPALRKIPSSVLWGYFAFMAIESLPGNQFWERICLLLTSSSRRYK